MNYIIIVVNEKGTNKIWTAALSSPMNICRKAEHATNYILRNMSKSPQRDILRNLVNEKAVTVKVKRYEDPDIAQRAIEKIWAKYDVQNARKFGFVRYEEPPQSVAPQVQSSVVLQAEAEAEAEIAIFEDQQSKEKRRLMNDHLRKRGYGHLIKDDE